MRRHGDAVVEPIGEEAPDRLADLHPAKRTVRMERRHTWHTCEGECGDADRGGHRLVQVDDIEALPRKSAPDCRYGARRENDVGKASVGRDDHRAPNGDHVRRRMAVPAQARVQDPREASGWVVAHDRARLDPESAERIRLQLSVLDHRPPEGPRIRNDDAHLHRGAEYA